MDNLLSTITQVKAKSYNSTLKLSNIEISLSGGKTTSLSNNNKF